MIGRILMLSLCIVGVVRLAPSGACAAPAKDDFILPKSNKLRLEESPGGKAASVLVDQLNMGWPAKVTDVNGQWLQISDEGGYTLPGKNPATGWVRKDEVVTLDGALDKFSGDIAKNETGLADAGANTLKATKELLGRLYWLRGIYWETAGNPQIALADFQAATTNDCKLADAWLRQGRMLAMINPIKNQTDWIASFKKAYDQNLCISAPKKAAVAKTAACTKCTPKPTSSTRAATWPETVPKPQECIVDGICLSDRLPAQFYLDLGRAYQFLYDANWDIDTGNGKDFETAKQCYQWAESSNRHWFRPMSAQGDLFRDRAEKTLDLGDDGMPRTKADVSADDLVNAVDRYSQSIRLHDKFDEPFRGRAEALRLLAVAKTLTRPTQPLPGSQFRGLFSMNAKEKHKAKNAVLDAAYESAKTGSFLKNDRDAVNLETIARIDNEFAYLVPANVSGKHIAQASVTLNEALLYNKSTEEASRLSGIVEGVATQSQFILADLAGQADVHFDGVWKQANEMKECVDELCEELALFTSTEYQNFLTQQKGVAKRISRANDAISEIDKIRPLDKSRAQTGIASTKKTIGPTTWPNTVATRSELVDRIIRIGGWKLALDQFKEQCTVKPKN